jgi:type III pantothenate kinase
VSSSSASLLLVDAGNTRTKFALCDSCESGKELPECTEYTAVRGHDALPWTEMADWLRAEDDGPRGVITGSNPAQIERVVREWPAEWTSPRIVIDRHELPLEIDVEAPERVGMDRLLNAVAANRTRRPGAPAIVIDVGTATTVDAVSADGVFLGGAILAGPELTARALHKYTAALPHVTLEELARAEPPVIGRNTQEAIASGLYWGHWQSVWSYCVRMMEPLGVSHAPQTILTGGAAYLFVNRLSPAHTYLPHLTLQGLAVVAQDRDRDLRANGG